MTPEPKPEPGDAGQEKSVGTEFPGARMPPLNSDRLIAATPNLKVVMPWSKLTPGPGSAERN